MDNKAKINELNRQLFILEMKDKWDSVDFAEAQRLRIEIAELQQEEV